VLDCTGGGPERMVVLMEGESLFNDATSLVLFEIFFGAVKDISHGREPMHGGVLEHLGAIVVQIAWLAAGET
jgi:NhaP-type Na+/H+ or K+/H+ antiporter